MTNSSLNTPRCNLLSCRTDGKGSALARHYKTGEWMRIEWDSGILTAITAVQSSGSPHLWIAPSLIDLQVNGYAAVDFQSDSLSTESLLTAVRALREHGCRRILGTLITAEWPVMLQRLAHFNGLVQSSEELSRAIVGWHLEGPFLSEQPGYAGAHNPAWMIDPDPSHVTAIRNSVSDAPILLTIAPERTGSQSFIEEAIRQKCKVSLGHTNASVEDIARAVKAGANLFTHLGNACPQSLDRHDNIIWRGLDNVGLTVGIIPDGMHVSPPLFRIMHAARKGEGIYWTTDAMSAAGAPIGEYTLGQVKVSVGQDGVVRNPHTGTFAGSSLRPIDGIDRGAKMLGKRWQDVWDYFSVIPAKIMDLPSRIEVGAGEGFCLVEESGFQPLE